MEPKKSDKYDKQAYKSQILGNAMVYENKNFTL